MIARSHSISPLRWFLVMALVGLTLLLTRAAAEAATFRTHIARVPDTPTSAETARVWINSDTAFGETAGVETQIGGVYTKYLGTFDSGGYPGANWRVDLPAQPNGTTVSYQLFTRNEFSSDYGFTGFNWSYTVDDGDVAWAELKHDTFDSYYRNPFGAVPAGTQVTLRFGTKPLNASGVDLRVYTYDPATQSTSGPVDYPMTYLEDADGRAIWTYTLTTPGSPAILYYHFVVTDRLDVDYYGDDFIDAHDNLNQGGTGATSDNQGANGFQLTVYDPGFETPQWLQDANVYQIFPDRFRNGDPTNDYCRGGGSTGCPLFYGDQDILLRDPWNTLIGDPRVAGPYFNEYGTQFYGGDLQGLIDKLDYLQAAGFDTIYTTPIFDGSSNHRYDTDDYLSIDPALGTQADYEDLIAALDARGMKLIVDGVFNHTSSDSLYFDRYHRYGTDGACESLASPYRGWFEFLNNDIPCGTGDYTGWFGYDSLAVLQDGSANVRDFIYRDADSVVGTWYDRGVSGWRFDVADEISHNWWRDLRPYAKADAPNGPLVGEVWPDASAFLLGDQLDSVMNYRFRKNVLGFVRQAGFADNDNNGSNEIISLTPSQFDRALEAVREDYPPQATAAMLNLLDSHDTNRLRYLVDIVGESDAQTLQRQKLAALFQYTYLGAPMVYYGDEVAIDSPSLANGVNGPEDDPYNRAPYPWADEGGDDDVYGPPDADVLATYSLLGNLRQNNEVLRGGYFATVLTGDTTLDADDNSTYAFARILGGTLAVVAMNPGTASNSAFLELGLNPGTVLEDKLTGTDYTANAGGNIIVNLPARTGVLLMEPTPTSLTVKKVVVGTPPGSPWQFGGDQGSFTLPAAGGETTFSPLPAGSQMIAETDRAGWVASVACSPGGETGTTFVAVTLTDGEQATCTFTNTLCQPGYYDNGTSCIAANPGYYVDVPGATSQTECSPGTYQGNYAGVQCDLADPGYYAGGTAAPAQTPCALGSYQPNSGQESCLPADPGYFVNVEAAQMQSECALGSYQPDSGKTSCLLAGPGYYVDTTAAIEQTACPAGTTSPQGSDSIDDCVATTADLTITKATDPAGGTDFPFTLDPGAVTFADKWGSNGVGQGQFNGPFGIAVDGDGNVYVADTFAYRVQKFDADGNFILMWGKDVEVGGVTSFEICLTAETCKAGTSGAGNGEFNLPHGIAVDGAGHIYVADSSNHRIQVFDANGVYLDQFGGGGGGGGLFNKPNGIALDEAGNIYVADTFNNRIQKLDADGNFLLAWGYDVVDGGGINFEICTPTDTCKAGNSIVGSDSFNTPSGVAVFGANVYVADSLNNRVQKFDNDGNYLAQWGSAGSGNSQFNWPFGLTTDAAGNVYIADSENDRVQKFDANGAYLGQWGSTGTNDGQFSQPTGLAVVGTSIYVTEYEGHRVQRFSQTGATLDDGQSHAFTDLAPGTYLVSELVPDDWDLTGIDCDGGSPDVNGNAVSVTLAPADDVTCTFSNTYTPPPTTGRIDIIKEATPEDDTEFDFTENIMNVGFTLTDPDSNTISFEGVSAGSYIVTEDALTGWTLDDIDCDDTNSTESVATKTATINLEAGETVTCTFYNSKDTPPATGTIIIIKEADPADNTAFSFTEDITGDGFTLQDPSDDTRTFNNVPVGSYTVSEDGETGWTLDDIDCDDTNSTENEAANINLEEDETVTCTFSNSRDTGTIVIVKDADPADDTTFAFTENITSLGFTLKDPSNNTKTFTNVPTGSYTVSEDVPAPWLLDDIDCDDINSIENEAAATATINLEKDETVTCTFSNSNTPPGETEIYVSTSTAGSIAGGPSFGSEDILKWDGSAWSVWFDGSAAGLTAKKAVHNINSFWIADTTAPNFVLSFTQNARLVPGIATKVDGMDLVRWNGSAFSLYFDGQDVGLTNKTAEKIDGLHVLDGSASPIGGGSCLAYLLISTQGVTKVPNYSGGTLNAGGEDVLGFCATALGATTTGLWHMVLDGSAQGMPKNSTDSISVSDDGQTLYLTTKGVFNVDAATGGHSAVYAYDFTSQTFSGPFFSAAAAGVSAKVDGLQVEGELP